MALGAAERGRRAVHRVPARGGAASSPACRAPCTSGRASTLRLVLVVGAAGRARRVVRAGPRAPAAVCAAYVRDRRRWPPLAAATATVLAAAAAAGAGAGAAARQAHPHLPRRRRRGGHAAPGARRARPCSSTPAPSRSAPPLRAPRGRRIDLLVLSHGHADHVAGLDDVVGHFPIAQALLPRPPAPRRSRRARAQAHGGGHGGAPCDGAAGRCRATAGACGAADRRRPRGDGGTRGRTTARWSWSWSSAGSACCARRRRGRGAGGPRPAAVRRRRAAAPRQRRRARRSLLAALHPGSAVISVGDEHATGTRPPRRSTSSPAAGVPAAHRPRGDVAVRRGAGAVWRRRGAGRRGERLGARALDLAPLERSTAAREARSSATAVHERHRHVRAARRLHDQQGVVRGEARGGVAARDRRNCASTTRPRRRRCRRRPRPRPVEPTSSSTMSAMIIGRSAARGPTASERLREPGRVEQATVSATHSAVPIDRGRRRSTPLGHHLADHEAARESGLVSTRTAVPPRPRRRRGRRR